ncbi:MAG: FABP family protein [Acidimicrobiales bacterium]|nr:FABP family protein [Acidimicrobiales bacterium]
MSVYPEDIFTEPKTVDPDTLANLGPLRRLAGIWEGEKGADINPKADGPERRQFRERIEMQPIDAQANGPQLFYGLRYHTHIVKPGEVETFHDQVGYWLWEPAARTVIHTLAIPRGQVLLAAGTADADATEFEVTATLGSEVYGILSNPFLDSAFRTVKFHVRVTVNKDGTWSYEEHTQLRISDRADLVDHVDRNTLRRIAEPTLNPLAASTDRGPGI